MMPHGCFPYLIMLVFCKHIMKTRSADWRCKTVLPVWPMSFCSLQHDPSPGVMLHELPAHFRINFKTLLITFKAHMGLAPSCIVEMLIPHEPVRSFRSSGGALLAVPKSKLKSKGDHTFSIRAPWLWNDLPEGDKAAESVTSFKSLLKTHFHRLALMWGCLF